MERALKIVSVLLEQHVSQYIVLDFIRDVLMTHHVPHLATFFHGRVEPWDLERCAECARANGWFDVAEELEIAAQEVSGVPPAALGGLLG